MSTADSIGKKRCTKCLCEKSLDEFYRNPLTADRRGSWCKDCERERSRKSYTQQYRQTENYLAAQGKYRRSEKGRSTDAAYLRKLRALEPEKTRARDRVRSAKKKGVLQPPTSCQRCNCITAVEAHHADYNKPLSVEWLCKPCHTQADKERRDDYRS